MHYALLRGHVMFRGTRPFLQSSLDEYFVICLVLSSLGVYRRPCVSPINAPLLTQYILHRLLQDSCPFLWRGCINRPE